MLTEAQIVDVTCSGIRVTQTGLPEGDRIEVVVSDPAPTTTRLATATTVSGPGGTIDVRLSFSLRGHERIHVEVEDLDRGAEYGETGTDLGSRCARSSTPLIAGALAVGVLLAASAALWRRQRSRRGAHATVSADPS